MNIRWLALSLISMVVVALMGLGWSINLVYQHLNTADNSDTIEPYKAILISLAASLDDTAIVLNSPDVQGEHQITIQARSDFVLPEALTASFNRGEPLVLASDASVSINILLPDTRQVLRLSLPSTGLVNRPFSINLLLTLAFYAGIIGVVLLWLYPLIKRLIQLSHTASAFGQGQLTARVILSRWSYITDIETAFNRMASRVEALMQDNKMLSRAVSHDLKTPLARLRFGIDALAETDDETTRIKYQQRINNDLTEMESLVDILLEYAKLDEASIKLSVQALDVNILVSRLYRADPALEIQPSGGLAVISGDERYLTMLFNNIINNAKQHAQSRISLSVNTTAKSVTVLIEDDGSGIADADREHALKPFWRAQSTAIIVQGQAHNYGMGLAIVARIAKWHGAQLSIANSISLGGAAIQLDFPTINEDEQRQ